MATVMRSVMSNVIPLITTLIIMGRMRQQRREIYCPTELKGEGIIVGNSEFKELQEGFNGKGDRKTNKTFMIRRDIKATGS